MTLCFLGYVPERRLDRVAEVVTAIAAEPCELRLEREPVAVPKRRPRLFALDAPSERAVALQGELSRRLVAARLYRPEKRPFWPHVTVARVRPERGHRNRPRAVARRPGALPEGMEHAFGAVRVTLYRSTLRPQGAEYTPLAGLDLPPIEAGKR
jgi:RNA 2',3'-cyclic 3'-phosphodiesterase